MIIQDDLRELFQLLNAHEVQYVVVGGYAVAFHGFVRATKDIDVLFACSDQNIRNLTTVLKAFGIETADLDDNTFTEPGRIIRIGVPPAMVELINGIGGVSFDEAWEDRVFGHYGDIPIALLSYEKLIRSKRAAGRPQDLRDLKELGADT